MRFDGLIVLIGGAADSRPAFCFVCVLLSVAAPAILKRYACCCIICSCCAIGCVLFCFFVVLLFVVAAAVFKH